MQSRALKSTFPLAAASLVFLATLGGCESDNNMRDIDNRDSRNNWNSGTSSTTRNTVGGSPQGTGNGIDSSRSTGGSVADYPPSTDNNTVGGTPQGTGPGGTRSNGNRSGTPHYAPDQNNTVGGTPQGTGPGTSPRTSGGASSVTNDQSSRTYNNTNRTQGQPVAQSISADDRRFVNEAAIGGMFEVQSSQIALQQNPDADLKHIAEMMIKDHTAANDELKAIARRKNITLPAELDARHKAMINDLEQADENVAFGNTYRAMQITAHEEAVALFAAAAENSDDTEIRAFAAKTLPTLRMHLEHVRGTNATP